MTRPRKLGSTCALAILLLGAVGGEAADFCIGSSGLTLVGKSFRAPPRSKCKPWYGFVLGLPGAPDNTSTGTACTAGDNSHVDFAITTIVEGGDDVFFEHLSLPVPSLTGGERDVSSLASGFSGTFPASKIDCVPAIVPVPKSE